MSALRFSNRAGSSTLNAYMTRTQEQQPLIHNNRSKGEICKDNRPYILDQHDHGKFRRPSYPAKPPIPHPHPLSHFSVTSAINTGAEAPEPRDSVNTGPKRVDLARIIDPHLKVKLSDATTNLSTSICSDTLFASPTLNSSRRLLSERSRTQNSEFNHLDALTNLIHNEKPTYKRVLSRVTALVY